MILAIVVGSAVSLLGGALLFTTKKRRAKALLLAMPFGAGALLAAAFFDLLPEAFELGNPTDLLLWTLGGFLAFFLLERLAGWFHQHHEHHEHAIADKSRAQSGLIIFGDFMHNAIDGVAIGAAFLLSPATGIIATIAVSLHEIPKELGTFALLMTRGMKDKKVLLVNIATAFAMIATASFVFLLGNTVELPLAQMLAITAGFFIYVAASDIIPDIHEQTRRIGTIQAVMLVVGVILLGALITFLHESGAHSHDHTNEAETHLHEESPHEHDEGETHSDEEHDSAH